MGLRRLKVYYGARMRALIISDVHSNLEALKRVMEDAKSRGGFDMVWCLGDVVGYGPDPGPCIELLGDQDLVCIAGNHDYAATGQMGVEEFNSYAAQAALWTRTRLSSDHVRFLEGLSKVERVRDFTLVHGSLREPIWEYLVSRSVALDTFSRMDTRYCLVGHSHLPFICEEDGGLATFGPLVEGEAVKLGRGRVIMNPGSVGQPRDGDPRPSYLLYDSDGSRVTRHRADYDVSITQERMRRVGLPQYLIGRLSHGR